MTWISCLSKFFDFIFGKCNSGLSLIAAGFAALVPLYPMIVTTKEESPNYLFIFTMVGYYVFFCLFMLAVAFRQKHIMHYCGFLKSIFMKSMFYVFLASLALCDITAWPNLVVGGVFAGCTALSCVGYCGDKDKDKDEDK